MTLEASFNEQDQFTFTHSEWHWDSDGLFEVIVRSMIVRGMTHANLPDEAKSNVWLVISTK